MCSVCVCGTCARACVCVCVWCVCVCVCVCVVRVCVCVCRGVHMCHGVCVCVCVCVHKCVHFFLSDHHRRPLNQEQKAINKLDSKIKQYKESTENMRNEIHKLRTQPFVFNKQKVRACNRSRYLSSVYTTTHRFFWIWCVQPITIPK